MNVCEGVLEQRVDAVFFVKEKTLTPSSTVLGVVTTWSIPMEDDETVQDGWKTAIHHLCPSH